MKHLLNDTTKENRHHAQQQHFAGLLLIYARSIVVSDFVTLLQTPIAKLHRSHL